MYLSRLGPLPYFGRETEGGAAEDGLASVRALVEAQLALEPHSQRGYRLGLVDPPDAGAYLSMLADLADAGKLTRRPPHHLPPSAAQGRRRTAAGRGRGGSHRPRLPGDHAAPAVHVRGARPAAPGGRATGDDLHHLVVAFDQSTGRLNPARTALHPIQPLAVPRRIAYREMHKTVELEPSSGGPFEDYDNLVRRLAPAGNSYLAVHQETKPARGAPRHRQPRAVDCGRGPPGRPRPEHRRDADHDRS